jgi:hypothetical protein
MFIFFEWKKYFFYLGPGTCFYYFDFNSGLITIIGFYSYNKINIPPKYF